MGLEELCVDIDRLAELPEDWDSYGAGPISPEAIGRAKTLVRQFADQAMGLPEAVGPTADSGVALIWKNGEQRIDVVLTAEAGRYAVLRGRKLIEHGPLADIGSGLLGLFILTGGGGVGHGAD